MRKKQILLMLGVLMALPAIARDFTYTYEGQTLTYTVLDEDAKTCGTKSATGALNNEAGNKVGGDIIIPSIANDGTSDYTVTEIGRYAFWNTVTSISLPPTIEVIRDRAFYNCKNLKMAEFPSIEAMCSIVYDTNNTITHPLYTGASLYINGEEITDLVIPSTVSKIGKYAFCNYKKLQSISIPESVTEIGDYAFFNCIGLKEVTIPNSVTYLSGFNNCTGLTEINIPESVKEIGYAAFSGLTGLTEINIPESVTKIDDYAFKGCTGLTEINIPESVTEMVYAFQDCTGLTEVTIPNSVANIIGAFYGCTNLTKVTIGESVTSMYGALVGCTSLTDVYFNCINLPEITYPSYSSWQNYMLFPTSVKNIIFGDKVEAINKNVLMGLTLSTLTIPENVKSVESSTQLKVTDELIFNARNCTSVNLSSFKSVPKLTIGEKVETIPKSAFHEFNNITEITIPESVKEIGYAAFLGCNALTEITISESVKEIGKNAFSSCKALETIHYNAINCSTSNDEVFSYTGVKNVTIGENVEVIPARLFYGFTNPTTLVIPNSVTTIGDYAFNGWNALESLTLGNSVTTIGDRAFSSCSKLTSLALGNSVTTIGESAFGYCSALTDIVIPNSVTTIGNYAFQYCSGLKSASIGNALTEIPTQAFSNCSALKSVTIGSDVTTAAMDAFHNCSNLIKVAYPSTASNPFWYYKNVTAFVYSPKTHNNVNGFIYDNDGTICFVPWIEGNCTIPAGVTKIADAAFSGCTGITSITANPVSAPIVGANNFEDYYETVELTIPAGSRNSYMNPLNDWHQFLSISSGPGAGTLTPSGEYKGFAYSILSDTKAAIIGSKSYTALTTADIPAKIIVEETKVDEEGNEITTTHEYDVVEIHTNAFAGLENLESVTIPESVKKIGAGSFADCPKLATVKVNGENVELGAYTFQNCTAIKSFDFTGVGSIGEGAFIGTGLTAIDITGVNGIGRYAFGNCTALTKISIDKSANVAIGADMFEGCAALTQVNLGEGVTSVGDYAFTSRAKLTTATIGKSVEYIGTAAFYCNNGGLSTLDIPKDGSLKWIGDSAFCGLRSRAALDLPDALEHIGNYAFANMRLVASVTLPANKALTIGTRAFATAQRLTEINFPGKISDIGEEAFIDNKVTTLDIKCGSIGTKAFYGLPELTKADIDADGAIGTDAFRDCAKLERVSLGDGVTEIGTSAFRDNAAMTRIDLGRGLELVKEYSLNGTAIDSLSFPSAETADPKIVVEANIFPSNYKLKYLSLGNRMKEIKDNAHLKLYNDYPQYTKIYVDLGTSVEKIGTNAIYISGRKNSKVEGNNITLPPTLVELGQCYINVDSIFIPASTQTLKFAVKSGVKLEFTADTYLQCSYKFIDRPIDVSYMIIDKEELVFGENKDAAIVLKANMQPGADKYYHNYPKTHFGAAVKKIEKFHASDVTFSEGIEEIATLSISRNTTIKFPASLKKLNRIDNGMYNADYPNLTEIIFADGDEPLDIPRPSSITTTNLKTLYLGRNITSTNVAYTLEGNTSLESLIVGDKVTAINAKMFKGCTGLKSAIMSDYVETIGEEAFRGCTGLDILSIPESVKEIGTNAYAECNNFSRIVARGLVPPSGDAGFGIDVEDNVPLYVPDEAFDDYYNSDLFFAFYTIETFGGNIVEEVTTEGELDAEFTVGSQFNLRDYFKFIFKLFGEIVGPHKAKGRAAAAESEEPKMFWFATDPHIVSVDQEGRITVNGEGEAEIWAYVLDGSDRKATFVVNEQPIADFNNDGVINMLDVDILLQSIHNPDAATVSKAKLDQNKDANINMLDVDMHIKTVHDTK